MFSLRSCFALPFQRRSLVRASSPHAQTLHELGQTWLYAQQDRALVNVADASFISNLIADEIAIALAWPQRARTTKSKDCDLYVKFTDVHVDYDNYHLILAIHFIDPKTGHEIGSIPVRPYYGNDWGLRGYLNEYSQSGRRKVKG